jgi:hypothetical protein
MGAGVGTYGTSGISFGGACAAITLKAPLSRTVAQKLVLIPQRS